MGLRLDPPVVPFCQFGFLDERGPFVAKGIVIGTYEGPGFMKPKPQPVAIENLQGAG